MLSKSQTWTLDAGQTAQLECEFIAAEFNLFDNPIIWRKRQHFRRRRTDTAGAASATHPPGTRRPPAAGRGAVEAAAAQDDEDLHEDVEEEETQINMMGNLVEPFISAKRFRPTFHNQRGTSYVFGLTITSKQLLNMHEHINSSS